MTPEQLLALQAAQAAQAQSLATLALWMPIILAVVGGLFGVIRAWSVYAINKRVTDEALAKQLSAALDNGLGVVQQAAEGVLTRISPQVQAAPIAAALKPGVQHVLDNAAEAVDRYQSTWPTPAPQAIAEKLIARAGKAAIATNLAISASDTSTVAAPLAPVSAPSPAIVPATG